MNTDLRLPGLDLLRAIAIVWVMLFHSFLLGGLGPDWSWLSRFGWMGVDLFFVLSGFLIGTQVFTPLAQGRTLKLADFYVRRAFRILPSYLFVLALYFLWPSLREAEGMEPAWKFLSFTLNLTIDYARHSTFSHAWSLCVEEHFYALFPLLAMLLARRATPRTLAALLIGLVLGGIVLRALAWWHGAEHDPAMNRNWFIEDIYYPTWNRLDGLLCGIALALLKIFRPALWQAARTYAPVCLGVGLALMACAFWLFRERTGLLGNTLGWPVLSLGLGLLVFAGAGRDNLLGRCRVPFAGGLAAMSYSLYLTHKSSYHVMQIYWGAELAGTGVIAFGVYGTAALLVGAALHLAVERPFLQWRHKLTARADRSVAGEMP